MEQFVLKLPDELAAKTREMLAQGKVEDVDYIALGDNKHFAFRFAGKEYPAVLANLPCIIETHKTYDHATYYKSGEVGQMIVVFMDEEEMKKFEQREKADGPTLPSGLTPPTTNIVKRKWAKTAQHKIGTYDAATVAKLEDEIEKMKAGPVEQSEEELVNFEDYMVDAEHPHGVVIDDEVAFLQQHPEILLRKLRESMAGGSGPGPSPSSHVPRTGVRGSPAPSVGTGASGPMRASPATVSSLSQRAEKGRDESSDDEMAREIEAELQLDVGGITSRPTTPGLPSAGTSLSIQGQENQIMVKQRELARLRERLVAEERQVVEKRAKANTTNAVLKPRFEKNLETAIQAAEATRKAIQKLEQELRSA